MSRPIPRFKLIDLAAITLLVFLFIITPSVRGQSQPSSQPKVAKQMLVPIQKTNSQSVPEVTASAVYIFDPDSKTTLYEKNGRTRFYPASTTKLMTALVALSYYDLDDVLTVKNGQNAIGQKIFLSKGDQLTVENLLYGLLVDSGNDAALVLAENYDGGYSQFVAKMNQKAGELGLVDTRFTNVTGLANPNHFTTARDLSIIANEAIQNAIIRKIVATKEIVITDVTGKKKYPLFSTNKLLGVNGVKGLKTGWTPESGECLVTLVTRDGKSIVVTLLNSTDRFGESAKLIDWVYENFSWEKI